MKFRSLGYSTDIMVLGDAAHVERRDDYRVVSTPSLPEYFWANCVVFDAPPGEDALERWPAIFAREHPTSEHMACGWDDPTGSMGRADRFVTAGWKLDCSVVFVASRMDPASPVPGLTFRPIRDRTEWDAVCAAQSERFQSEDDRRFQRRLTDHFRLQANAGKGAWFGAFRGDELVADLGICADGDLGRFQAVETRRDYRRRGIASALIRSSARYAFERMGVRELVILATPNTFVAELYASLGFVERERAAGVYRTP